MLRKIAFYLLIALIFTALITGCSGGSKGNPVVPNDSTPQQEELAVNIPDDLPVGTTAPMIFGMYEIELQPSNLTGQIRPIRMSSALGDDFHVDITPFLTVTPCASCVDIKSIALNPNNNIEVTIQTRHPFDTSKRYDLHVFDMRGILVTGENPKQYDRVKLDLDGDGTRESPARGNVNLLVNADGYTSFYDGVVESYIGKIFDGNLCPYRNLWEDSSTSSPGSNYDPIAAPQYGFTDLQHPTGHNVFPMGSSFANPLSRTTYELNLTGIDNLQFLFILEASYGQTTRMATRKEPRFFLPEFHRKDPWLVRANLISNDLTGKLASSNATLEISVCDWQAGYSASGGWDYHTSNLTAIKYPSDVKEVVFDIPEILDKPITLTLTDKIQGTGTPGEPYVWDNTFANEKAADFGTYYGLVAVRDNLEGSPNAPMAVSGSAMTPKRLGDVTTYQSFEVYVERANLPPVADVQVAPDPVRACKDVTISVGPNALDPDGQIVKYEYDIDYPGTPSGFVADYTQDQGNPDFGLPIIRQFDASQTGNHLIAQRVTDDGGLWGYDVTNVQVNPNQAPTAVLQDSDADNIVNHNDTVTFQPGVGTGDPDGVIVRYEYDWAYNGTTFVADVTQNQGQPNFGVPVPYTFTNTTGADLQVAVAFRVSDDGCPELNSTVLTAFTVHPLITDILFENFETTTAGSVPTNWGVTGHSGSPGSYFLTSQGYGCTNTTWRWGVTINTGQCEGGESRFLNESGAYSGQYNADGNESYNNRGHIVYTPQFVVPANGAILTIRHTYSMCWSDLLWTNYLDGGTPLLTGNNPGAITWSDFCNTSSISNLWNNRPLRQLSQISGPTLHSVSPNTTETHPLYNTVCNCGSSGGWTTSTYSIPNTYAGWTVRLGFLFASDDLCAYNPLSILPLPAWAQYDCPQFLPSPYGDQVYPGFGWRINWVRITAN